MDTINYDFESALEAGFKTLFDATGLALRVADDADEGELPDERITLEIDAGGPISDEHLNSEGNYDNYAGTFTVEIHTPRVAGGQVAITQNEVEYSYAVSGAGSASVNSENYIQDGVFNGKPNIVDDFRFIKWTLSNKWEIGTTGSSSYFSTEDVATPDLVTTWEVVPLFGTSPVPTVTQSQSTPPQFKSRHRELVATTRKALEEIDAATLLLHWPGALSPTKIKPQSTNRENDKESQMTTLTYELQFRIA